MDQTNRRHIRSLLALTLVDSIYETEYWHTEATASDLIAARTEVGQQPVRVTIC